MATGAKPREISSQISTDGFAISHAPADGQHLLLPAGHGPRSLLGTLGEQREDGVHALDAAVQIALGQREGRAESEVLRNGEVSEDASSLLAVGDA